MALVDIVRQSRSDLDVSDAIAGPLDDLDQIGPETEEAIVTAGQLLIDQGFQEGFQQGERAGFQQGERATLLLLLRHRFGNQVDKHVEERVATASIERIAASRSRDGSATSRSSTRCCPCFAR
jgi:hypothetical protein